MPNATTIKALKQCLAETYVLYAKTQNYHWNITGPSFISLHTLLEGQYKELAEAIDTLAERIVMLGEKAPGQLSQYLKLSQIPEGNPATKPEAMLQDLITTHQALLHTFKAAQESVISAKDVVTESLIIERLGAHEKMIWMLKATLN